LEPGEDIDEYLYNEIEERFHMPLRRQLELIALLDPNSFEEIFYAHTNESKLNEENEEDYDSLAIDLEQYKKWGVPDVTMAYAEFERMIHAYHGLKAVEERYPGSFPGISGIMREMKVIIDKYKNDKF
jgi:hypothetical protein